MPLIKGGISELMKNIIYPKTAADNGIFGKVLVKAVIDVNGNVIKTEIEERFNEELNSAAKKAVKMTKFEPGIKDGKKVRSEVKIPIMFRLDDC